MRQHDLKKEMDFNIQIWQTSLLSQQAKPEGRLGLEDNGQTLDWTWEPSSQASDSSSPVPY